MIWTKDYETISEARAAVSEEEKTKLDRALEYARDNLTDGYAKDEDDFIIINVEGYKCIALITNEFFPIPFTICARIFPFDENRIYPMQEVELVANFKVWR